MSENNSQESVSQKSDQIDRRGFLKFIPHKIPVSSTVSIEDTEQKIAETTKKLDKLKIKRRHVVIGLAAATAGVVTDSKTGFFFTRQIIKFFQDPIGRFKRIVTNLKEDGLKDVQQKIEANTTSPVTVELGNEIPDVRENWMDSFPKTHIFELKSPLTKDAVTMYGESHMIAVFELGNIEAIKLETQQQDGIEQANFPATLDKLNKAVVSLPGNQTDDEVHPSISAFYSAYETGGKVYEYGDSKSSKSKHAGGRSPDRGAVVVDRNNNLRVYKAEELFNKDQQQFTVKVPDDAKALESVAFTISSTTKEENLQAMDKWAQEDPNGSGTNISNERRYNSCLCTFQDQNGQTQSCLIARYHFVDVENNITKGIDGSVTLLTVRELSDICQEYARKNNFTEWTMAVPDPDEESTVITSKSYSWQDLEHLGDDRYFYTSEFPNEQNKDKKLYRVLSNTDSSPLQYIPPAKNIKLVAS